MDFSSDSDSDISSSDSEQKKIIDEVPETEQEITTPFVLEDSVLEILVQRIKSIASSFSIYESLEFQDAMKNFITDGSTDGLFIPHENLYIETYSPKNLPRDMMKFTYFIKSLTSVDLDESNFFFNIIFGSVDTNFEYVLSLILKFNYVCVIYQMKELPERLKLRLTRKFEKFLFRLTKVVCMKNGLSDLYLPVRIMIHHQKQSVPEMQINDLLALFEDAAVSWCEQLNSVVLDEEINHQFPYNFTLTNILQFWQCERYNLQQMKKCLQDSRWQLVLKILNKHNSAHLKPVHQCLKKLQKKEDEIKISNQFLLALQQFTRKLDDTPLQKIPPLLPDLWLLLYFISQESAHHRILQNKELLVNGIIQEIMNICLLKIQMKNIHSENTEECMNNLIECVRMCCLLKELFIQSHIFSDTEEMSLQQMTYRIDIFVQRCIGALNLCSQINIFSSLSHAQKEIQFKVEYYVKIKTVVEDICKTFFMNLKNCHIAGHDFLGLHDISWFDLNYKFFSEIGTIEAQIKELVDTIFLFVSTSEDGIEILRVTYGFSKLPSLRFFFSQKEDRIIEMISKEINEIDESLLGNKVNSNRLNTWMRSNNNCIFSFRRKRRIQFLFQMVKRCKWFASYGVNDTCSSRYRESIRELDTYLTNEYKIWLEKYESKILNGLSRPLLTKCSSKDGFLEVNIHRQLLQVIQNACDWIQMGFNLLANVSKLITIVPQLMSLYAKVESFVLAYNRIFNALTPDEQSLFFMVLYHCKDISRPMLSIINWDHDNAGRIVTESLKQIQVVENLVHTYKQINLKIINICVSISSLICAEIQQSELDKIVQEFKSARLLFIQKLMSFYNQICDCVQSLLISFRGYIRKQQMKVMWMLYMQQTDSLLQEAFKCCLKNNILCFMDHMNNSYESSKLLMKIKVTIEVGENTVYFVPKRYEIYKLFSGHSFRICEVFKIFPRILNKFCLAKTKKNPSYASVLLRDQQIIELQAKIETAVSDNLEKLGKYTETWNQYKIAWKRVNENSIDVDLYETLLTSYTSIIDEMQLKKNIQNEILFEVDVVKLKDEIISQCEERKYWLSDIIRKNMENLLQKIKTDINEECIKLNEFDFNHDDYKKFMKLILQQKVNHEMQICEVQRCGTLLSSFSVDTSPFLEEMQDFLEYEWKSYINIIDRYRFKIQVIHNEVM